jgi:hypothetical protein
MNWDGRSRSFPEWSRREAYACERYDKTHQTRNRSTVCPFAGASGSGCCASGPGSGRPEKMTLWNALVASTFPGSDLS